MAIVILDENDKVALQREIAAAVEGVVRSTDQELTPEQKAKVRENIGAESDRSDVDFQAEYFDIDDDGLISLKPEYRGLGRSGETYSISDKGLNVDGSKNAELPERLVIPEIVNGIAVTALAPSMFNNNKRIKFLSIPEFTKTIPDRFCENASGLREVKGTLNVETLNKGAFQYTGISKAYFPKLKNLAGEFVFAVCPLLTIADLGNEITTLPRKTFYCCDRLSSLRNAEKVTSVGKETLDYTRRLKNLPFLPNLVDIGQMGFFGSRVNYNWSSLSGCTFGANATVLQINPTDFWSGCTFTAHETQLKSTFNQHDPSWAATLIGDTSYDYGTNGCNVCCAASAYSIFENKELSTPMVFETAVRAANSSVMSLDIRQYANIKRWLEAVGYTVTYVTGGSTANTQAVYNALSAGGLVMANIITAGTTSGHSVLFHGIDANGEIMCVDSAPYSKNVGVYEALTYKMPIQNLVHGGSTEFLIITKP